MNTADLIAIDTHTHAEVSCRNPFDAYGEEYDRAADRYFGSDRRPTIDETVAYYRERKIGLVMFTVDSESQLGRRRIPNEEIAQAAQTVIVSTHLLDHVRDFERVVWLAEGNVRGDGPGREVCAAYEFDIARRMASHRLHADATHALM